MYADVAYEKYIPDLLFQCVHSEGDSTTLELDRFFMTSGTITKYQQVQRNRQINCSSDVLTLFPTI